MAIRTDSKKVFLFVYPPLRVEFIKRSFGKVFFASSCVLRLRTLTVMNQQCSLGWGRTAASGSDVSIRSRPSSGERLLSVDELTWAMKRSLNQRHASGLYPLNSPPNCFYGNYVASHALSCVWLPASFIWWNPRSVLLAPAIIFLLSEGEKNNENPKNKQT